MDIEAAAESLGPDIQKDVNWFAETGQRYFVDPVSLSLIGLGLIKLFAAAAVTAAGTETGKLAVDYVRDLMDRRRTVEQAALKEEVAAARALLASLPPDEADQRLAQARAGLADQFAAIMPRPRAARLAERVGAASTPLLRAKS